MMKAKFKPGERVRTTVIPFGCEAPERGIVVGVHEPYEFKEQRDRSASIRQNYAVQSTRTTAKFVFDERDLVADPAQAVELASTIAGYEAAQRCNQSGMSAARAGVELHKRSAEIAARSLNATEFTRAFMEFLDIPLEETVEVN